MNFSRNHGSKFYVMETNALLCSYRSVPWMSTRTESTASHGWFKETGLKEQEHDARDFSTLQKIRDRTM